MRLFLANKWEALSTSFWFVPALMVIGAVGLSLATLQLDQSDYTLNEVAPFGWTFLRGPEGSRAVLATIAGSMMTIAGVTFSITIVALQLASTQFGPRLLRNFMRDRGNQVSIGTFIATYTYCLMILRTINGTEKDEFIPHASVTVGFLLALGSLGVFIYFIHHSAESIQAENVIFSVSRELDRAIERLYPERIGRERAAVEKRPRIDLPANFEAESRVISTTVSNYLQAVDSQELLEAAKEHDLVLRIHQRPGKFFFQGSELVHAWPAGRVDDEVADKIRGMFYFGNRRTLSQDVEFAIDQLVEVAVRALSPGVNDPFTAINCVERLCAALSRLSERQVPSRYRYDDDGRLRIVTDISTLKGIIDDSFDQIRQAARGDAAVTLRLLETIEALGRHARSATFRRPLKFQAEAIFRGSQEGLKDTHDRKAAEERYRAAVKAIAGNDATYQAENECPDD